MSRILTQDESFLLYPMKFIRSLLSLAGLLFALVAFADTAFETAFRFSLLQSYDDASGKFLQLADAIPEADYGWKPMEGVNTVREVLVHVTEANLGLGGMLGGKAPAGLDRKTAGKSMNTKAEAIAVAKQSIAFMHDLIATMPVEGLAKEMDFFGGKAPKVRVVMVAVDHAHEHLGQLIAYARANHVKPPWSN